MNSPLNLFEEQIHIHFKDQKLLENVFIHRSFLNENKELHLHSNEKLEFLGDSVLSLITSMYLYKLYPLLQEGDYTDIKAAIVRTESLAEVGKDLHLGEFLFLSKGEENSNGRENINLLADCFEALVAAIFIDHGFDKAYEFVLTYLFSTRLDFIVKNKLYLSPKSRLQEIVQAKHKILPLYRTIDEQGPEHHKVFNVSVYIHDKLVGNGTGTSKKQAEEHAAKNALENMQ
ncbi:ribonuclease III [Candidatus Roizmanbacteria bacterium]|nr:ribonuclease III [Candidatus Roizmanbacteria bacterium]